MNNIKKIAFGAGAVVALGATWVVFHKPSIVSHPCWRTTHRADGRHKVPFGSPIRANWQTVIQLLLHGEVCLPYQYGDAFYTGHSKSSPIQSINPFKAA